MGTEHRVTVGRIIKAQGLRGEVRVSLFDGSLDVFQRLNRMVAVREGAPPQTLTLESVRSQGRAVIARFAEAADRTSAENLAGMDLEVPVEEMPGLPSGEYYTFELEGLEVVSDAGDRLGVLAEVLGMPAHDVYVVRDGEREILLPATDEVIKEIDLESGRMVVHLLEGLLD